MKLHVPVLAALLAGYISFLCFAPVVVPLSEIHAEAVRLDISFGAERGHCSGTVIGPHAILTAAHCLANATSLAVDGVPVEVSNVLLDGNDHGIVIVTATFAHVATLDGTMPAGGAVIQFWGNPAELRDAYHWGHVAGTEVTHGKLWVALDIRGFFGDSGSGVFDASGHLVGVISIIMPYENEGIQVSWMGAFPLQFTPEQWVEAQR